MTSLAVVTPAYNDAEFLSDCVSSVRAAADRAGMDVQHVVIDDASKDRTPNMLPDLAEAYGLTTERLPVNRGCSAALNAAVRLTDAEWLLVLASDDMVKPIAFTAWRTALNQQPGANVIYSDLRQFGRCTGLYRTPPFDAALLRERSILPGSAFLRRSLWDAVGGFDEGMKSAQDWDFYVRADMVVGLKPVKLPNPVIRYRYHFTERLHDYSSRHIVDIRHTIASRTPENAVLPAQAVAA
jgi:glycosyltransferase involved in cell wall biosynthesis